MAKWFKRDKQEDRAGREPLKKTENETPEREDSAETFSDVEDSEELEFIFEVEEEPEPPAVDLPPQEAAPPEETVLEPEPGPAKETLAEAGPPEPLPVAEKPKDKKGLLARLKERLANTRAVLNTRVDHLLLGVKEIDEDVLEDLEEILITADLGVKTTQALIGIISDKVARKELDSPERLKEVLRDEMLRILSLPPAEFDSEVRPHVIMVVGVNGVGKTTTIAKLAHRYITDGQKVMIAAGDTFRAAAVEQLQIWAGRVGADLIKQQTGADPSAVVFDALHAAQARGADIVIIDTAGRLHTKVNLMEELKKINRIAGREMPGAPHEVLMVLDATTGQNAVNQARLFNETVPVSHLAMTKLDGTAKGGILVAMCHELGLPIRYIGIGEGMDDLRDFDPKVFAEALFA